MDIDNPTKLKALRRNRHWEKIWILPEQKWYILSEEARNILEDAVLNGCELQDKITLEIADSRNGSGIGKRQHVYISDAIATLVNDA